MAYKVIILYQLYMPSYFLGTFTEYPNLGQNKKRDMSSRHIPGYSLARNPKSIVERKQPVECIIVVHTAWEACWSIRSAFKQ